MAGRVRVVRAGGWHIQSCESRWLAQSEMRELMAGTVRLFGARAGVGNGKNAVREMYVDKMLKRCMTNQQMVT